MSDIRNFEEYRRQVLDSLGEDYTVEDLRNFERWRLKVLEGLGGGGKVAQAIGVTNSANGSIASFDDGGDDLPMKSLKVEIVPKQSGSGDPSPDNVRPIEGWSGVNVSHSGADQTNPTVYLIEFKDENGDPVTVYGGTLDVVSGKLVIDKAMANLGAMDWASRSSADRHIFRTLVNGLNPAIAYPPTGQIVTTAICEQYTAMGYGPISASDNYKFAIGIQEDPLLVIINFDYSTAEDFKTAMNGVKLVYPLATPIEIDLTPTEIRTLKGVNNVWADTGDVDGEYIADTKTYIDNKVAELQALVLENIGG